VPGWVQEFTYENLPEIFLITTMMVPPMKPMVNKTPAMIPTKITIAKPSEWEEKKESMSPRQEIHLQFNRSHVNNGTAFLNMAKNVVTTVIGSGS
jgi:hypothetical protein